MTTELVKSISIDNLISQRAALLERLEAVHQAAIEGGKIVASIGLGSYTKFSDFVGDESRLAYGDCLLGDGKMETATKRLDDMLWEKLMDESGIRTYMDSKARTEWNEAIQKKAVPPFEKETILSTFAGLRDKRGSMMERGVIECFKHLSWDFKTNLPMKFGKRIILSYLFRVDTYRNRDGSISRSFFAGQYTPNHLSDLDRVFRIIDGKPELDHRNDVRFLIVNATHDKKMELDTEYLHIKWFLKGTGHVTFKRPELVQQCNRILAKHYPNALPAA